MSAYILPATVKRARQRQREHDAAEGGWWCKACHREGRGKIAAGKCFVYELTESMLALYRQQQERAKASPGVQLWAAPRVQQAGPRGGLAGAPGQGRHSRRS